jgi:hypothetical protein
MKLPRLWRPRDEAPPAARETTPPVPPIDSTMPRDLWYRTFDGAPGPCPRCGAVLQRSNQPYVVATKSGRHIADSFVMGGDFGWFCPRCPSVVINSNGVGEMLAHRLPDWDVGTEFAILGLVAIDAFPPEQLSRPLGEVDAIPLVPFTAVRDGQVPARSTPRRGPSSPRRSGAARGKSSHKKRRSR